jgi:predicted AAA+ superfamily ATPase
VLSLLDEFLEKGGFPEVITTGIDPKLYLSTLVENILTKDLFYRYKIRYVHLLKKILYMLYSSFTKQFSFQNIAKALNVKSVKTVEKYIWYLQQVYLVWMVEQFSFSEYKKARYNKKIFSIDNGFVRYL